MSRTRLKELKQAKRLMFSIFTQIKLEHDYFKSYLKRLSAYDSNLCNVCKVKQTPEHILLSCRIYKAEQKALKKAILQTKPRTESEQNSELSVREWSTSNIVVVWTGCCRQYSHDRVNIYAYMKIICLSLLFKTDH